MSWFRRWRYRRLFNSEVFALGTYRVRVTRRRRKIIGIELWVLATGDSYGYLLWKAPA